MATVKALDNIRLSISPPDTKIIQWSLDARRAIILGKRAKDNVLIGHLGSDNPDQPLINNTRNSLENKSSSKPNLSNNLTHGFKTPTGVSRVDDYVAIIDIDFLGYNKGTNVIKLPFIPKEINHNHESTFATIRPIGRNTPKYHYVGSEDKIEFEIDWHSFTQVRDDVIAQCRSIEALSKSDGYKGPPHRILLQWGVDNLLYKDQTFIVLSAPYRLVQFNKAQINQRTGAVERNSMLPVQAYQRVTLARISSTNLSKTQIEYVATKLNTRLPNF